jgi:two-component system chemotaxis sensor kinase CheA
MLLKGKRIFIIEDNAGNLAIASAYLESQGAIIRFERRGVNTPQVIVSQLPIDLILTDLMLPKNASGFDVIDQIRQVPDLAQIPVVAVSAADPDVAMPIARQKGFAGFISKPITPRIMHYVADVLNGKQVWIGDSGLFA